MANFVLEKMLVEINGQLEERNVSRYEKDFDEFDSFMPMPQLNNDEMVVHVVGNNHPVIIKGRPS